jgi:hypothetical protein
MGRKRFKTRRALLIVFLSTTIALAIIAVLVRHPVWFLDFSPNRTSSSPPNLNSDSVLIVDASEWALAAIVGVVLLSGIAVWVILFKANR